MGTTWRFTCSCGFAATAAGDFDVGDAGPTVTIVCRTCRKLIDVSIDAIPPLDRWKEFVGSALKCPKVRSHPCSIWTYPGPCPRCGATLRIGDMLRMWEEELAAGAP